MATSQAPGRDDVPSSPRRPPLGQILLRNNWLDAEALDAALEAQARTGVELGHVVVAHGLAPADRVAAGLAQQLGIGAVDPDRDPPDPVLAQQYDPGFCLSHRILPWRRAGTLTSFVTDRPEKAAEALGTAGASEAMALVSVAPPAAMDRAFASVYGPELARRAARHLSDGDSVRTMERPRWLAGLAAFAFAAFVLTGGTFGLLAGLAAALVLHLATLTLRAAALVAGARPPEPVAPRPDVSALTERKPPPSVSILVALYREGAVAGRLVGALARLDYPRELLEVKLLVEEDDAETREALAAIELPSWISVLPVPDGAPRTKPRALNHALPFCRGEIIGVLDAEDRPDPQQLNMVAAHLANAPDETMAVQCQLATYNAGAGWLTRCFQLEYAIWFEVLLRGYRRLGLPLPLGGTSVYFRAKALRALQGWDAHNVTEDADLGVRLARAGGHCAVLRSQTGEEATTTPLAWIRQRSRWTKGYLLTWLCHMRAPATLWRDLGPRGFLAFQAIFLGGAATYLAQPLFVASAAAWLWSDDGLWHAAVPEPLTGLVGASLVTGWAIMLAAAAIAMHRRRMLRELAWAPLLPFYWWLGTIAAWKAVLELLLAPYYWDKTCHGLSAEPAPAEPAPAAAAATPRSAPAERGGASADRHADA